MSRLHRAAASAGLSPVSGWLIPRRQRRGPHRAWQSFGDELGDSPPRVLAHEWDHARFVGGLLYAHSSRHVLDRDVDVFVSGEDLIPPPIMPPPIRG